MSVEFFVLMLSIPVGVLLTAAPAWLIAAWSESELGLPPLPSAPAGTPVAALDGETDLDASQHPRACVTAALGCAHDYRGVVATQWHPGELDPMTWLLSGRVRDRFETTVLAAIGAVRDWLTTGPRASPDDPRVQLERERIHQTLAALIETLPTFPADVELGRRCQYRVTELQRICLQLRSLAASIDRHRQVELHPPMSPYR